MSFVNPASVLRLTAGQDATLQQGSKISTVILNGDGANPGLLQVFAAPNGSDPTKLIAEIKIQAGQVHIFDHYAVPVWGGGGTPGKPLFCSLTGTGTTAYIAWE